MSTKEKLKYYLSSHNFKYVKYLCIIIYIFWMLFFAVNLKLDILTYTLPWLMLTITCGIAVVILGYAVFTFFFFDDKSCEERKRLKRNVTITLVFSLFLSLGTALIRSRYDSFFTAFFGYYPYSLILAIYVSPSCIMLWNEIKALAKKEVRGIVIIAAILCSVGLLMIIIEYSLLLFALYMPTGSKFSDFNVTDAMILVYNLIPAGLLAAAAPIKLFS